VDGKQDGVLIAAGNVHPVQMVTKWNVCFAALPYSGAEKVQDSVLIVAGRNHRDTGICLTRQNN